MVRSKVIQQPLPHFAPKRPQRRGVRRAYERSNLDGSLGQIRDLKHADLSIPALRAFENPVQLGAQFVDRGCEINIQEHDAEQVSQGATLFNRPPASRQGAALFNRRSYHASQLGCPGSAADAQGRRPAGAAESQRAPADGLAQRPAGGHCGGRVQRQGRTHAGAETCLDRRNRWNPGWVNYRGDGRVDSWPRITSGRTGYAAARSQCRSKSVGRRAPTYDVGPSALNMYPTPIIVRISGLSKPLSSLRRRAATCTSITLLPKS